MERFTALPRGMQLMLVGSVLLLIDSFLNWQEVSVLGVTAGGISAWHGWGVLVGLLTILLLVWLVVRAATDIQLPVSDTLAGAVLGALIVLFTVLKVLVDNEFRTVWAWIGLVLAVVIAIGAWLQVTAGGGMDTLRSEASGLKSRAGDSGAATSAPPPPPQSEPTPPVPPVDESPPQSGDRA